MNGLLTVRLGIPRVADLRWARGCLPASIGGSQGVPDRPQKITFADMRERHLLIYCPDYRCSHLITMSGDRPQGIDNLRGADAGSMPKGFDEGVYLGRARKLRPIVSEGLPCLSISLVCCFLCI
jgi:hypothetical protein